MTGEREGNTRLVKVCEWMAGRVLVICDQKGGWGPAFAERYGGQGRCPERDVMTAWAVGIVSPPKADG